MSNYWRNRYLSQEKILLDKSIEETENHLIKLYSNSLQLNERELRNLLNDLQKQGIEGEMKINDLYRYNRYWEVRADLNRRLLELGRKQNDSLEKDLVDMYKRVQIYFNHNPKFMARTMNGKLVKAVNARPVDMSSPIVSERAQAIVNSVWCADGKYWSERTWVHMDELQQDIENGLLDIITRGTNPDELTQTLMRDFGKSYHQAQALVRTELNHVYTQAAAERYADAGCEFYEVIAQQSEDECLEYDGQVYRLDMMVEGENAPPFHTNCKCTIVPVIGGN